MSKKISWDVAMVLRVLKNQVYTGALVSHRRKSCGVGSRKTVPQEPIIVEGTHEAIISKETFLLAQRVIRRGNHEPRKVSNYPLRGLVCCGNCKRTMTRRKRKDGSVFYTCHHSNHDRDTECRVGEKYSESRLEDIVYNAIGDFLAFAEKQAVQNREVGDIRKTAIKDCAAKLKALQTQTDQLKNGKLRLYENTPPAAFQRLNTSNRRRPLTRSWPRMRKQFKKLMSGCRNLTPSVPVLMSD